MTPISTQRARWFLVSAAVLFATGGPAIKAVSLSGWQVACLRSAVAAIVLLVFLRPTAASFGWRSLLVGVAHGATMVLFVASNKLTTATHAILLQDSSILYVLLLAPWLLREKLRAHDGLVLALVVAGLALCFSAQQSAGRTAPNPTLGNWLAAASGVSWAFTVIGMRWLASSTRAGAARGGDAALSAVVCGNLFACLLSLKPALPLGSVAAMDLGLILFLGAIQIALAYVFVARGLTGVSALEASLILLIEPVLNPILTWIVHAEEPHPRVIAGGVLILAATIVKAWWERRARETSEPTPTA